MSCILALLPVPSVRNACCLVSDPVGRLAGMIMERHSADMRQASMIWISLSDLSVGQDVPNLVTSIAVLSGID